MRTLGIIPARAGSKRLPNKNMRVLCGKPLIAWTIESAKCLDRVVVTTDSEEISLYCRALGIETIDRPAHLATDDARSIDAVRHVLDVKRADGYRPDAIVLLQPTSPLRLPCDITGAVLKHKDCGHPVVSVSPVGGHIQPLVMNEAGVISPANIVKPNGAVYVAQALSIIWGDDWYGPMTVGYPMPAERSIDIDTMEDFDAAEKLLAERSIKPQRVPGPYG